MYVWGKLAQKLSHLKGRFGTLEAMKKHILNTLAVLFVFFVSSQALNARELVIGLSSAPSNLSPFFATDANSQNIGRLLYLTLTDFGRDMSFNCRACKSFEERFEDGKHKIHFKLREDLTFWDGEKINAQTIRNVWEIFTNEESPKSIFRFAFAKLEEVKVLGEFELELIYPSYSADNLSDLALLKILKIKTGGDPKNVEDIIGSGPYQIASATSLGVTLTPVFEKSRDNLHFKVVKDETTLALKMMNNEIDLSVAQLSPRKVDWIDKNVNHLDIVSEKGTNYIYVGLNHKNPHLSKAVFREALDLLIPRNKLVEYKMKKTASLANSLFSPSFTNLYQEDLKPTSYDPEAAKKLFLKNGYTYENGALSFEGVPVKLDWKISNNKATEEIVDAIIDEFSKAGISVTKTIQEWGTFMRSMKTGQFDLVMSQWVGFTGPGMLSYVFSTKSYPPAGANRGYFHDEKLDELLAAAERPMDQKQRLKNYREAMAIAVNERAYLSLWHPDIIWIARSCLKGVSPYPNGNFMPILDIQTSGCYERK